MDKRPQNIHKPHFSSQLGERILILVIVEVVLRPFKMHNGIENGNIFQSLLLWKCLLDILKRAFSGAIKCYFNPCYRGSAF